MLRLFSFGVLLPTASALCLINGTEPAARKNLVNPNGEAYPVGIYVHNWAAASAASLLVGTVIEEVLGYNVSYTAGGATLAGFNALLGCTNPGNLTHPDCGAPVTYHHIDMEAWVSGYAADWERIQTKYKDMAPVDLAPLGYEGKITMYIPSGARRDAYAADGVPMEYYQSWDAQWKQPWKYFDTIPGLNKSWLRPCSQTAFSVPSQMELYLQHSGDADGVQNVGGSIVAKCWYDTVWLAPACRSNASQCVVYITGGDFGWGMNEFMQKATAHHMPLAVSVAGSWSLYTTLPLTTTSAFYWWTPDPTFLDLAPVELQFPRYDKLAWDRGDLSTAATGIEIRTAVSRDLATLAPKVQDFLKNTRMDLATMNKILLDNKNSGDTMEEAVCRWLNANTQEWEAWLPDDTKCFAGFGLFHEETATYVDNRDVPEGIRCQPCPSGTFSAVLLDSVGTTYICEPCPLGTSQASGAQQRCEPCAAGEYQDVRGQLGCKRCPVGRYQETEGAPECTKCPVGARTLGRGSTLASDCGCEEGRIDVSTTGPLDCAPCGDGLQCPLMGTTASLITGNHSLDPAYVVSVVEGYYATQKDPLKVYKCGSLVQCPGGRPGTCAGGLTGVPCAECPQGQTWNEAECQQCEPWRQALWALSVVLVFAFLTISYYLMTSKVTAKASVLFTTTCAFGMLISLLQSVGIIGMMTVDFPVDVKGFLSLFQVLLLDLDSFGFACFAGASTSFRYIVSVLFFPAAIGWMALNFAVSRFVPRRAWDITKTASCAGQVLQVGFSTMSTISLAPLMCYSHPNGEQSLLKYPNVICGSAEHSVMLVAGVILLIFGVLGFLSLCTYAAFQVPHWSAAEKHARVRCFRFLVFRFRLDSWWFGVPLLLRGPLISLPIVLATDYQAIQTIFITTILGVFLVIQALAWPWKVPLLNALDSWISYCILILVAGTALYVEAASKGLTTDFVKVYSMVIMVVIFSTIGGMILMATTALAHRTAMGGSNEYAIFNLSRSVDAERLAEKTLDMAGLISQMDQKELENALDALSVFDTRNIMSFMTMLAAEVVQGQLKARFSFGTRVASASFGSSEAVTVTAETGLRPSF